MLNHFTFNGHSTGELGLLVSGINIYGSPSRIVEKVTIPYRSGDLLIDTGAYTNYMLTYTVDIMDNTKATAEAISKWLLGSKGYCELTDTYNPEIYRVASYYNQLDYTLSALYRYGKATITFDCKPQKYLTANQPVSLTPTTSEATSYSLSTPAMPLPITLEGNTTQGANPTPEAPQQIHSVKGDNEIRVIGKNLFDDKNPNVLNAYINGNTGRITSSSADRTVWLPIETQTNYCISFNQMLTSTLRDDVAIGLYSIKPAVSVEGTRIYTKTVTTADNRIEHTFNSGTYSYVGIKVANINYTNYEATIATLQMGKGSTPTTYEPYKAKVYPINLPVENLAENHLTTQTISGLTVSVNGGVVTINGTATTTKYLQICRKTLAQYGVSVGDTLTLSGCANGGSGSTYRMGAYMHNSGGGDVQQAYDTGNGATFTIPSTANDIEIVIYIANGATINNLVFMPQLERGSKANSYTPYGVSPIELNALGTYKDYFYKSDGKWYLHKAIQKIDVGTLTWARRATNIFGSNLPNGTDVTADISAHMSNYFPIQYVTGVVNTQINTIAIYKTSNITSTTNIYISLADIDTVGDLTTWFNSHATELYYPLATPTETEITDTTLISQLNALSKAKTYDGVTNIVQEGTDAQFKLSMPVPTEITSEYFGEPIITVNEVGTIVWNDSLIKVNSAPVTINSQTLQCYYYTENKNNDVEINDFPKYEQGDNYIGSTMALTVVPNYWKL